MERPAFEVMTLVSNAEQMNVTATYKQVLPTIRANTMPGEPLIPFSPPCPHLFEHQAGPRPSRAGTDATFWEVMLEMHRAKGGPTRLIQGLHLLVRYSPLTIRWSTFQMRAGW